MIIYLAGTLVGKRAALVDDIKNRLSSYWYYHEDSFYERPNFQRGLGVNNIFLDSGAFSLHVKKIVKEGDKEYKYYHTKEFWDYVDSYANFVKKYEKYLDVYVSVDVIKHAELTLKVQDYLENTHKLKPMPVLHTGASIKEIEPYLVNHERIGMGGLGQATNYKVYTEWADRVFKFLHSQSHQTSGWKIHGFAMTSAPLMYRYPWYSVDSSTWMGVAFYGGILIPRGYNDYTKSPWKISISNRSPEQEKLGSTHLNAFSKEQRLILIRHIGSKGFNIGKSEFILINPDSILEENERWFGPKFMYKGRSVRKVEKTVISGLCNNVSERLRWNMLFFEEQEKTFAPWQWFIKCRNKGFDI